MPVQSPTGGYSFNTMQEIKSHSSVLYNERMAILLFMLDMNSIDLNTNYSVNGILKVRGILNQIYKNVRMLIRNNPMMRATLNLDTQDPGIYITDLAFGIIDKMVDYCESTGYTTKRCYILTQELNSIEVIIKDILQYYHYFIRPDFRQKPDIEVATLKYKEIADKHTLDELRLILGKKHRIDFESLGSKRVALSKEVETDYDEELDGPKLLEEKEEEEANES